MAIYFSLLIAIFMCLIIPFGSSLSFNYTSFSPSNDDNIAYERAFLDSNRIQLASSNGTVGRATYNKLMRLWDRTTRNPTDFSAHFIFEIDSQNRSAYGDGLAFFLAPQGSRIPNITKEGSFGLSTNDEQPVSAPSNSFLAVEFDSFKNTWDPPVNMWLLAMNIHSLYSWEFSSSLEIEDGSTDQVPPPSDRRRRRRRRRGSKKTRLGLGLGLGVGGGIVVSLSVLVWFVIGFVRGRKRGDEEDNDGVDEKMDDKFRRESKGEDEKTQAFNKAANSSA